MLKVVFNRDGSIKTYELPTYVIKGSGGSISDSIKLEVAVEGLSLASGYLVNARFKLPNGTTNTLALLNDLDELSLYGNTYSNGKYGYLTTAQTYYEGVVKASLEITSTSHPDTVLYTFPFNIVVNPSTYDPDDTDELITNAQFKNLELNYAQLSRNYFTVSLETNVIDFITNNGIDGKIACFSIGSGIGSLQMIGCLQKTGGVLHFELESVGITPASRYAGSIQGLPVINATITFNDLLDETYTNVYETTKNKVSSWSATPNNTRYPSEKLVYDSLGTKLYKHHITIDDADDIQQNINLYIISTRADAYTSLSIPMNEIIECYGYYSSNNVIYDIIKYGLDGTFNMFVVCSRENYSLSYTAITGPYTNFEDTPTAL